MVTMSMTKANEILKTISSANPLPNITTAQHQALRKRATILKGVPPLLCLQVSILPAGDADQGEGAQQNNLGFDCHRNSENPAINSGGAQHSSQ